MWTKLRNKEIREAMRGFMADISIGSGYCVSGGEGDSYIMVYTGSVVEVRQMSLSRPWQSAGFGSGGRVVLVNYSTSIGIRIVNVPAR